MARRLKLLRSRLRCRLAEQIYGLGVTRQAPSRRHAATFIATALLAAHRRGVDVRGVVDKSNATARYTVATFLANQGVPVRVDYRYAILHDKFIVANGATVETGSFNFTASAESKNAENVLVMHDSPVAARYMHEWDRLWAESEELKPRY